MAASAISSKRLQGIATHDPRVSEQTLTDLGAGTLNSSYTQAGAYPGVPSPSQATRMVLSASGEQSDKGSLAVSIVKAGNPGTASFAWTDKAGAPTVTYGWDGFQAITGTDVIYAGSGSSGGSLPSLLRMDNGNVLLVYEPAGMAISPGVQVRTYDPTLNTWVGTVSTLSVQRSLGDQTCPCVVAGPADGWVHLYVTDSSGRNVIMVASDDYGATWTAGAALQCFRQDLPAGSTIREIRGARSGGQVLLCVQYSDGANEQIAQYASADGGVTFDQVDGTWGTSGDEPDAIDVTALPGGGFLMIYSTGQASSPRYKTRRVGSAYETIEDADAVTVVAMDVTTGRPSCAVWVDEDGTLYSVVAVDEGSTWSTRLHRSDDLGDSWYPWGGPIAELNPGAQDAELNEFACTSTGGLGLLVTRYTVPAEADTSSAVLCVYLGGHSTHTLPATDEDVGGSSLRNFPDRAFVPWSQSDDNGKPGAYWTRIEVPDQVGWTASGAATGSIGASLQFSISASSNALNYTRNATDATVTTAVAEFEVKVPTSSGDLTNNYIAAALTISDYDGTPGSATFTYTISVRFADTGFALYDELAGPAQVGSDESVDLATDYVRVRVAVDSGGYVKTWYGARGHETAWTEGPSGSGITSTPSNSPNALVWGQIASSSYSSFWNHVGWNCWGSAWGPYSSDVSTFVQGWAGGEHGRPLSALPVLVYDGVRIAAADGPALIGDTWTIAAEYTYALTNIHPQTNPSPRRGWRSRNDQTEMLICWQLDPDFASARQMNHALVIALMGCNFKLAYLEGYDGATWQSIASLDASRDWDGLDYDRRGRTIIPQDGASVVGDRYFWHSAHVGDTVDLGTGTIADDYHKITRNTEGAWVTATQTKRPTLVLADDYMPAGLSAQQYGTLDIWRTNFGQIIQSFNSAYQYIRLRIPAQNTVDNDYRIGQLFFGPIAAFGHQYDRGRVLTREFDAEVYRRKGGTRRGRTLGPSRRVVEIAWAETAIDASPVQASSPDPNWLRGQTGVDLAIATPYDVIQLVEGVAMEAGGPVSPVLYLARVPTTIASSHALSEPRDWIYGRIETEIRSDNVMGDEGATEVNRLSTITIREEK